MWHNDNLQVHSFSQLICTSNFPNFVPKIPRLMNSFEVISFNNVIRHTNSLILNGLSPQLNTHYWHLMSVVRINYVVLPLPPLRSHRYTAFFDKSFPMQSHSLTNFGQELTYFKQFCQKYYRAIIIICVATVMVVTERSSSISWFSSTHYESLILYGLIPLALLISLGYRTPHSLALSIGHWRFWLPASLLYLAIAIPLVIIGIAIAR